MDDERQDLLALLMPVARSLRQIEEAAAARRDLSMWQYAILSVVDRLPGSNQGDVATALGYSKNRIIADLDHLEAHGLLTRRRAADRRANTLVITDDGRRVMRAVQADIHAAEDALLAPMPAAVRRTFVEGLRTLHREVRPGA